MKIKVDILKHSKLWNSHRAINKTLFSNITKDVLSRFENFKQVEQFEVSILLTDNDEMLRLNSEFRKKENVTNVLSFTDVKIDSNRVLEFQPNLDYMYLGDIAFGYQVIMNESIEQDKTFENHFIHLFVHSILHLIGFDHKKTKEAKEMEQWEITILESLSVASPY